MKYTIALVALAASAFALPQEASSITSAPVAAATGLTPQVSCALSCPAGDVTCQAACLGVARPNASQAVDSYECAAKCDQGDGSKEATEAYAKCQQDCFASLFPSSQTAFGAGAAVSSQAPSAGATATDSAGNAVSTGGSSPSGTGARASGSSSATGSAAQSSGTGAANSNSVQIVGAGLAGLMAIFAL